jgi:hypothetical protein
MMAQALGLGGKPECFADEHQEGNEDGDFLGHLRRRQRGLAKSFW